MPELLFDQGLGDLFVVRVAGNVANKSSLASVEYAVAYLDIRLIVILGHESCGAVTAALGSGDREGNLGHLLAQIDRSVDLAPSKEVDLVVRTHARLTARRAVQSSPTLRATPGLVVTPAYYGFASGVVEFLEPLA